MKKLIIAILILCMPALGWGATIYVDKTGVDANFTDEALNCSTPTDNDYDATTRQCGSGSATIYSSINGALDNIGVSGEIIIQSGTWSYVDGTELDAKLVPAGTTVRGINRDTVILTTAGFPAASSEAYWVRFQGDGCVVRDLTFRNFGHDHIIRFYNGAVNCIVQDIVVDQYYRKVFQVDGTVGTGNIIRRVLAQGQVEQHFPGSEYSSVSVSHGFLSFASSSDAGLTIEYSVSQPTADYKAGGIYINGTDASDSLNLYNNVFVGTYAAGIYASTAFSPDFKNNIFAGIGIQNFIGHLIIEGACLEFTGDSDWDYNFWLSFSPTKGLDSEVENGTHDVTDVFPFFNTYGFRKGRISIGIDDYSWGSPGQIYLKNKLSSLGYNGVFYTIASQTVGGSYDSDVQAWLDDGNEVASHGWVSYSGANGIVGQHAAVDMVITNGSGANVTADFTIDRSGAGWKSLDEDYSNWTGTVALTGTGITDITINLVDGVVTGASNITLAFDYLTVSELCDYIQTQAGLTCANQILTDNQLAITLADNDQVIANSGNYSFDAEQWSTYWIESKFSKDQLEAYIQNDLSGYGSYSVVSFGCAGHESDADFADAHKEAGYTSARGDTGAFGAGGKMWDLTNLMLYGLFYQGNGEIDSGGYLTATQRGALSYIAIQGGYIAYSLHEAGFDEQSEQDEFDKWFTDIAAMVAQNSISVVTQRELAALATTGTCIDDNDSLACDGSTVGSDERWSISADFASVDYSLRYISPAIDAGVLIDGLHVDGWTDLAGTTRLYGDGVDIGAYERYQTKPSFPLFFPWGMVPYYADWYVAP